MFVPYGHRVEGRHSKESVGSVSRPELLSFLMIKAKGPSLAKEFLAQYDTAAKDAIWRKHQQFFRHFWESRIRTGKETALSDAECDAVIRILDVHGRGNTKSSEAVARVMLAQGKWRKLLTRLRQPDLGDLLDAIFRAENSSERARFIDELYAKNTEKNYLTGPSASALNAFIAAYDPFANLTIVSLRDREKLVEAFGREMPEGLSIGERITIASDVIREELAALGLSGSGRTLSNFCYWTPVRVLWKGEDTAKKQGLTVEVTVPVNPAEEDYDVCDEAEIRQSMQVQAILADLGARMGFKIWIPRPDRGRVLKAWTPSADGLLDELPFNYEATTLKTIEAIDVIWVRNRSIVRAFEVEHTTSVYSGILRMADLLALQPNMAIKLHLVAPDSKREKVFREIKRPVFSLLEGRPLCEMCTFISYDSVREIRDLPHGHHLTDSVIEDFEEWAQESD